ncbi:phosphotransferase [Candidatus Poriferisodalis multihospitum]|uniref:phosphotransferase n=1 Tax=Candidatus Poriferisodalis multihospitum TaxID=2983191 RepID=UPI002B2570B9|nr:phosphotransferase [Candidatus Poriferisodalis multihospitum]
MGEELLSGGLANAGAVVRSGPHVLRPATPYTPSIHRFLASLERSGFEGASVPVGLDPDGRERLSFIDGDVPVPPYPDWAQSDSVLASAADLMRCFHTAASGFDPSPMAWNTELADPAGGMVVCHNDVCLENVVFRDGRAVALIDFDFAAPGRPLFDLACFARMCVPIDDDMSASRLGWHDADRGPRLRLVAESYGLDIAERAELLGLVDRSMQVGAELVRRRAEAGDPSFVKMWAEMGGQQRFDRRRDWWAQHRPHIESTVLAS